MHIYPAVINIMIVIIFGFIHNLINAKVYRESSIFVQESGFQSIYLTSLNKSSVWYAATLLTDPHDMWIATIFITSPIITISLQVPAVATLFFCLLWTIFVDCCSLSCVPIWLWNVVMNSSFVYRHTSYEKISFISPNHNQTALCIINTVLSKRGARCCLLTSLGSQLSNARPVFDLQKRFCAIFLSFLEQPHYRQVRSTNHAIVVEM